MRLALAVVASPLPDVDGLSRNRAGLVVVCPLAHHHLSWRVLAGAAAEPLPCASTAGPKSLMRETGVPAQGRSLRRR